jgi:hypothetical protein
MNGLGVFIMVQFDARASIAKLKVPSTTGRHTSHGHSRVPRQESTDNIWISLKVHGAQQELVGGPIANF